MTIISREMTRQRKAQEQIRNSEALFHSIFDYSSDGIMVIDLEEQRIRLVNQAFCRMLGREAEEIAGQSIEIIHPSESHPFIQEDFRQMTSGEKYYSSDIPIQKNDGSVIHVDIGASGVFELGGKPHAAGWFRDISERKRMTDALRKSAHDYRMLAETTRAVPWRMDVRSRAFFYMGPQIKELLGYPVDSWTSEGVWASRIHPEDREQAVRNYRELSQHGEERSFEYRARHADGRTVWIQDVVSVVGNGTGVTELIGFFLDVTRIKEAEARLRETERELRSFNRHLEERVQEEVEKNKAKEQMMAYQARFAQMGELLSMIAHQWRQPLNAISAAAIDLNMGAELGESGPDLIQQSCQFIEKQTGKMSQTINDFMNFFKSDKTKEYFAVRQVLDEVEAIIGAQLRNHNIILDIRCPESIQVMGVKNDLEHVVLNLVTNARDALEEKNVPKPEIRVDVWDSGEKIAVRVADNAGGIPKGIEQRIFEPYFSTKKGSGKGLGIGLFMSKQIVENSFGGTIRVFNQNDGANFEVSIPKVQQAGVPGEEPDVSPGSHDDLG